MMTTVFSRKQWTQRRHLQMSSTKKGKEGEPCPPGGMTVDEYRVRAKEMVDYIANYLQTIRERRTFPDVQPGYMQSLVPDEAPARPDKYEDIVADVERVIMPGVTHWQSPYMHAYFPALNSFPSLLGDMLADAISCLGFTWASSPACTELETIVMDWLGKMMGMPACFLHGDKNSQNMGGGCIQTTASDCTFVTLLAARTEAINLCKMIESGLDDAEINGRLIGYCSDQAHSSVEKAGLIGLVKMRFLHSDENLSLRGETLQEAIRLDREKGFIPFYVCATLGTTGACAFDNLKEIGPICEKEHLWLHIDAAYAGTAFICPEFRQWMAGVEYADSFAFNPSKWLMVHFDCSAMWVKDARALHRTFNVEPLYLQHENSGAAIDYMHWQIALSRRFRSLKLWFVLRSFGVEGLQAHIRRGVELAVKFENMVRADKRFEMPAKRILGMVVFRIAGANELTEDLLKRLNKQGKIHMVPASLKGKYVIRFTVTSQFTTIEDIERDWKVITDMTKLVLEDAVVGDEESIQENDEEDEEGGGEGDLLLEPSVADGDVGVMQKDVTPGKHAGAMAPSDNAIRKRQIPHALIHPKAASQKKREFGISLLLSNVPMSPKVVNGSFAALFDENNAGIDKLARQLSVGGEFIRLSPRKRGKLGDYNKQMSLDYSVLRNRRDNQMRMKMMGSLDSKIDDILALGSKATPGEKGKRGDMDESEEDEEEAGRLGEIGMHEEENNMDGDSRVRKVQPISNGKVEGKKEGRVLDQEHWDTGHSVLKDRDGRKGSVVKGTESPGRAAKFLDSEGEDVATHHDKHNVGGSRDGTPRSRSPGAGSAVSNRSGSGRSVMEFSKAVCSKVKEVFMTSHHTSFAPEDYITEGHCKYCGHVVTLKDGGEGKYTPAPVSVNATHSYH